MKLVIEERRHEVAQVEKSRGVQENYKLSFIVQVWYSEKPKMYVQILKRIISNPEFDPFDVRANVGGDEIAEAILVDKQMDSSMVRKAFNKLDSLSFENFIGDWCTEQGGYQVLDIRGEKK